MFERQINGIKIKCKWGHFLDYLNRDEYRYFNRYKLKSVKLFHMTCENSLRRCDPNPFLNTEL